MCGIFGIISFQSKKSPRSFMDIMTQGLQRLEYRGYDSSGIFLASEDWSYLVKSVGNVNSLDQKIKNQNDLPAILFQDILGISHTRWATHGSPSEINTHPHVSSEHREFVVVHNGIITNHAELRIFLQNQGYIFHTETDTEVIPILCKYIHDTIPGLTFPELLKHVTKGVEGSFAMLVASKYFPSQLVASKRGSPLILGIRENGSTDYIIASDRNAIIEHTNQTICLDENDILHLANKSFTIYNSDDIVSRNLEIVDTQLSQITKGSYDHFMLKEIHEQVISIQGTMTGRITADNTIKLGGIFDCIQDISHSSRIVFIACGSSYHACLATRPLYEKLTNMRVSVENSCDFVDRDVHVYPNDACIFVSQSGETADVIAALKIAKQRRAFCIGITNVVGSTIDRETTCGIHVNAGSEIGVASTKAYTSQIVVLIMLATVLSNEYVSKISARSEIIQSLQELPNLVEEILACSQSFELLAQEFMTERNVIFIGRSQNYATALEASLKLKEVAYLHCEGVIAGELKHGTLALIDENVLVVVIATEDEKMKVNIEQLKSRNARMIIVTDTPSLGIGNDKVLIMPKSHRCLRPILDIIPFQLVSYYLALKKGYNVDQPRNLAKSVTVTD